MQNAIIKLFPRVKVRYEFILRSKVEFPDGFADELRAQAQMMVDLSLSNEEAQAFQEKCGRYLDPTFFIFLKGFRYKPENVGIIQKGGELFITVEGYWSEIILWEITLMAIVSELYFIMTKPVIMTRNERKDNNIKKAQFFHLNNHKLNEFGTRRRFSYNNQVEVIEDFVNFSNAFKFGTSNVHLALTYNLPVMGTHAHEWFMFMGAKYGFQSANIVGLGKWADVYNGDLGIALSDTYTSDVFLKSFDSFYAKLFDGVRHDSGDPIEFGKKVIAHYEKLGIDPTTKTIVFSDSLNMDVVAKIAKEIKTIRRVYGIGTFLTNDLGISALNMVIKMVAVNFDGTWVNTVKLSDNPGKHTGNIDTVNLCKQTLNIL
jgi:nicotinate phosphoribosyltransferase